MHTIYGVNLIDVKTPWQKYQFDNWNLKLIDTNNQLQILNVYDINFNKFLKERNDLLNMNGFKLSVNYYSYDDSCFLYLKETYNYFNNILYENDVILKKVSNEQINYLDSFIDKYLNPLNTFNVKTLPKQYLILSDEI